MPRTNIPVTTPAVFGGATTDVKALATAGDATNDHSFVNSGAEHLDVFNDGAGAVAVTVKGVGSAGNMNRAVDTTFSVAAGEVGKVNLLDPSGFNQAGGVVHVDLDIDTSVSLLVTKLQK